MKRLLAGIILLGLTAAGQPGAGVDVEVRKVGADTKTTIDLSELRHSKGGSAGIFHDTLENDLVLSGWFRPVASGGRGTILLRGSCKEAGGLLNVECGLSNRLTGRRYFSRTYNGKDERARELAHKLADEIVMAVKGVKGIASTRIAMVGRRSGRKDIYVCDADGGGTVQITNDGTACLSPTWAGDGQTLFYTSFHKGFPDVYAVDLASNRRQQIAAFPGLNTGADVSPDGRSIALTLSKDGNPDLYTMNLRTRRLTRLTKTRQAAEASPRWSPDGRQIVFVSDRAGRPNLYTLSSDGGDERRLTFRGRENVAPSWGPDGRIAYSSRREGRYHICVIDPKTGADTQVTSEYVDHEDPSWAPDARHIVYTRTEGYTSDIYILDTMGDSQVRLTKLQGDWYSPAWSSR